MCIYRCDSSPCVSIATSALNLAARRARPVGAGRGHGFGVFSSRPRRRAARGASTGAGRRRTGPTTSRRGSGSSSSSPAIAGISTSISSEHSLGTRPFSSSLIGASWIGGRALDPTSLNGARATDARFLRSTGSCARLAWPSCPRLFRRPSETPPASTSASRRRSLGSAWPPRTATDGTWPGPDARSAPRRRGSPSCGPPPGTV